MSQSPKGGKQDFQVAPQFHKPLKDLSTTQGECLVLECRVKGQPPPVIRWTREGDVIEDCPDFRILHRGEVATLVIGEAFPEDTGRFVCEASNVAGTTTTSCKVTVKGGGYHTVSTKSAATSQSTNSLLQPTKVLPAYKSESTPPHATASNAITEQADRPVQISKLNIIPKRPRIYVIKDTCPSACTPEVSSNHINRPTSPVNADINPLHVNSTSSRSQSPAVSPQPLFEETAIMAAASPQPLFDNRSQDENHNFKAEKDRLVQEVARNVSSPTGKLGKQEYKVSSFEQRLMNEIEYRLERTPPVYEDPDDAIFNDVPISEHMSPTFVSSLKNFKALDGTSAKFVCQISAKPAAKVFWFKDGKQISKRSQHYVQRSSDNHHELHIAHLCLEDDGNYTALAINPQGRVSSTGRLAMISEKHPPVNRNSTPVNVSERPSTPRTSLSPCMLSPPYDSPTASPDSVFKMPDKGELAADEESPVEKYYRPTFIQKPPADTTVAEGKLVRFDVKVTGLPTPEIEWLINGLPVRQDQLHKVLVRENNVHSLLLERASPMDEGQYTIVATNKAGRVNAHIQLHVTPREYTAAPAFVQRLSAQCVADGDAVRLEARVVGSPKPTIAWKKGSDQVLPDSRHQLYQDDSGYACLQITHTKREDAAWYTCSATNKAGISSCNCKLDVYCPTSDIPTNRRRIRTPHRYANLAKVAGVDMREALTPDSQANHILPESEEL